MNKLILGNSLEELKELEDNSVDSICTDPPYELGFMGKKWDSTGIANNVDLWVECLRVLKPGGHLLAFSGTRTYHRMAVAIEDAGFEVRDMIEWVYGSGFPKSLNIGKAVDKLQGNEREKIIVPSKAGNSVRLGEGEQGSTYGDAHGGFTDIGKGTSEWEGWGTALKPAHEPICMARKPLAEKSVAQNVLKYGTGGINIDESRVGTEVINIHNAPKGTFAGGEPDRGSDTESYRDSVGRFPANLIHDNSDEVRECFPESKSGKGKASTYDKFGGQWGKGKQIRNEDYGDSGSASRFFKSIIYNPKASKSERNKGCEELEEKVSGHNTAMRCSICNKWTVGTGHCECPREERQEIWTTNKNNHPTVKPIALMEYLIKMVTPKGGTVLDPFMGSGSTGVAAKKNGYDFIGIDMTPEYIEIAKARINHYEDPSD